MKLYRLLPLFVLVLAASAYGDGACALKQSTASQEVLIGPFFDRTDGVTAETALTINAADVRISKAGANIVAKNSGGGTHDELGLYQITLDATDTNTVGTLDIAVDNSNALPVWLKCYVYEENVYDMVYGASADLGTTIDAIEADTQDLQAQVGTDGAGLTAVPWNSAWDAEVESEVDDSIGAGTGTALTAIPWNSSWDSEAQSEANDAILANFTFTSGSVDADVEYWDGTQVTTALETSSDIADAVRSEPCGTETADTIGDLICNDVEAIAADTNELQTDDIPGTIAALNDISTAQVNTEVDNAIETYHLDHLLAADYDPASKPGTSTALLNELVEDDSGVSRFSANALEQGPSGGGGGTNITQIEGVDATDQIDARVDARLAAYDPPTRAELSSDISGLNDLDAAGVRSAVGLASANLDTQIAALPTDADVNAQADQALSDYDPPTRAELSSDIAGLNDLDAAGIRTAIGLASGNLDTQLAALPTASEISIAVRDQVIDDQGAVSLGCAMAASLARLAGDWSGTTSVVYQDATGTETRVTVNLATANQRDGTITCPTY